jgi:hypothetical protein
MLASKYNSVFVFYFLSCIPHIASLKNIQGLAGGQTTREKRLAPYQEGQNIFLHTPQKLHLF